MPGEKILIVDDEPDMVILLKNILEKEFFKTYVANDSREVIELAKVLLPELILLDVMMPKLDGFEVCRRIRDDFHTSHIPIIIVSVKDTFTDKIKGLKLGADDYITKPFDNSELIARVRAVIRRTHLERDCNPLTQLPGNLAIEYQIRERLKLGLPFAFIYADLDDFKSFNDYYGYSRGDLAIKLLADIVLTSIKKYGDVDDFIGHIGGDDFIIITKKVEAVEDICKDIINNLKTSSPELYDQEDRKKGYIEIIDRIGNKKRANTFLDLTVVATSNQYVNFTNSLQISDTLAEIKRYGKQLEGSIFIIDRRGRKKSNNSSEINVENYKEKYGR